VTAIPVLPVVTVTISGEIDIATSRTMRDALATGPGPAHLEVDMSAVTFMDASGIGVLLAVRQQAVDGGGSLTLRAPSGAVRRLTGVLGLDDLLATRCAPPAPRPSSDQPGSGQRVNDGER
jgi:anti-sigma B factor antagonist